MGTQDKLLVSTCKHMIAIVRASLHWQNIVEEDWWYKHSTRSNDQASRCVNV